MIGYIAGNSISELIKKICKELNIIILNHEVEEIDFFKYIKQTKLQNQYDLFLRYNEK